MTSQRVVSTVSSQSISLQGHLNFNFQRFSLPKADKAAVFIHLTLFYLKANTERAIFKAPRFRKIAWIQRGSKRQSYPIASVDLYPEHRIFGFRVTLSLRPRVSGKRCGEEA